jgi:type VI secretion system secreted protein Hcp
MSIYLHIPQIKGDVTDAGHANWIQLHSLEWQCERHALHEAGKVGHRSFATPQFSTVSMTKKIDQASPQLFLKACASQKTCECIIHVCHAADSAVHFLEYSLGGVFFSAFDHLITSDKLGHEIYEQIKLDFNQMKMRFCPRDSMNQMTAPVVSAYDLTTMEAV